MAKNKKKPPDEQIGGTGGDGGHSTLGGVYPDEGQADQGGSAARSAPRARRRPDDTLAHEIHEILTKDPELDATEIEVQVERGAVTLTGIVDSREAKLLAEELVESLPGVRQVHNGLTVTRRLTE